MTGGAHDTFTTGGEKVVKEQGTRRYNNTQLSSSDWLPDLVLRDYHSIDIQLEYPRTGQRHYCRGSTQHLGSGGLGKTQEHT